MASRFLPLLLVVLHLLLLLPYCCLSQMVMARGFLPFGQPDMVASGTPVETVTVRSQGECAARALLKNSLGFNLQREAESSTGLRSCEPTNARAGCHSVGLTPRSGWDYYLMGRTGQDEPVTSRKGGYTTGTTIYDWSSYPAVLATAAEPHRRWGVDCNRPADSGADKECSRYILTGIDDGDYLFDDLDYARCFTYGVKFRVAQEIATMVAVGITPDSPAQECPRNHVVTALSDTNSYYNTVDWMKCNLLLGNWRINYDDCTFIDPGRIGGSTKDWYGYWNIGTPQSQVYGVIGIWRINYMYSGFKQCRLYRIA